MISEQVLGSGAMTSKGSASIRHSQMTQRLGRRAVEKSGTGGAKGKDARIWPRRADRQRSAWKETDPDRRWNGRCEATAGPQLLAHVARLAEWLGWTLRPNVPSLSWLKAVRVVARRSSAPEALARVLLVDGCGYPAKGRRTRSTRSNPVEGWSAQTRRAGAAALAPEGRPAESHSLADATAARPDVALGSGR